MVVVGGDQGMTGAARLAGRSAFAAGAGLVHLLVPEECAALIAPAEMDDIWRSAGLLRQILSTLYTDLASAAAWSADSPRIARTVPA